MIRGHSKVANAVTAFANLAIATVNGFYAVISKAKVTGTNTVRAVATPAYTADEGMFCENQCRR